MLSVELAGAHWPGRRTRLDGALFGHALALDLAHPSQERFGALLLALLFSLLFSLLFIRLSAPSVPRDTLRAVVLILSHQRAPFQRARCHAPATHIAYHVAFRRWRHAVEYNRIGAIIRLCAVSAHSDLR